MVRNRWVHKQNQRMVGHFQLLWETGFILASKPKALKEKLKVWSRSDQANLGAKRRNLESRPTGRKSLKLNMKRKITR